VKAALAHHLVTPVEPPANQHKSNGERCDAKDYIQRHGVTTTTTELAAGRLNSTGVRRLIFHIETHPKASRCSPGCSWRLARLV
jgi:hypothetical protein